MRPFYGLTNTEALLIFSPHQRWFLDSLSRSCVLENSRVYKDLMKGLWMSFTTSSLFSQYRTQKQNIMSEIEITEILEDLSLAKVFQERLVLLFPQHTLQENNVLYLVTFWRPNSSGSWMNISISLHRKWVVCQKINFLTLCSVIRLWNSLLWNVKADFWIRLGETERVLMHLSLFLHNT